ncbi:MAG: PEGA domain-containing protein [Candidatus Levybacteria bacterium]|nr:PEGA domain-containing protein [Candidatus Levybacteria bacterium]
MNKHLLISIFIFAAIIIATAIVILFAKGYRFGFDTGKIALSGTGLLVVKSVPDGAQVFINDHLTTATDSTINLDPGKYKVRISKEGYFSWEKEISIQEEVVSKAEALLFPSAPKLESITDIGVGSPVLDPSQTKIAFIVSSQSARTNGVYVFDMSSRPILTLQSATTQIADDTLDLFSEANLAWSPDGKEIIATISARTGSPASYLLSTRELNQNPRNVTLLINSVQATWQTQKEAKENAQINSLSRSLRPFVRENFKILAWSPDDTKILYQASASAELPIIIKPRLIGTNPTREQRNIEVDRFYVYDIKEDRNYELNGNNFSGAYAWYPDSKHLIFVKDKKVSASEFDGGNETVVYAGPFNENYVFPWPDATRIVILTDLGNLTITPNLYTISLK